MSRNLGTLTSRNPLGYSRPVTGLLYLYLYMYNLKWKKRPNFFFCYQRVFYLFIKMLLRKYFCKLGKSIAKYMKTKVKYLLSFTMYKKCKYIEITFPGKILTIRHTQIKLGTPFRGHSTFYHSKFRVP
jgi:hypothetical protein